MAWGVVSGRWLGVGSRCQEGVVQIKGGWFSSRAGGWFWFTRGAWLWYKWEGCVWWFRWSGSVVSWLFRWEFGSGGGCRLLVHVRRGRGVSGMGYLNIRTEQILCLWWEIFNFLKIYLIRYTLWFFLKSSDCLKYGNFILSFLIYTTSN